MIYETFTSCCLAIWVHHLSPPFSCFLVSVREVMHSAEHETQCSIAVYCALLYRKAEFLKHTDTRKHVRAKFSKICAKLWLWNAKIGITGTFFIFLVQFDKVLSNLLGFIAILVHNSAQNYIRRNSVRAKQFTFRRSVVYHLFLAEGRHGKCH